VYDRYGYDSEKKTAINFWNRQLTAILNGQSASRVVPVLWAHWVCGIMMQSFAAHSG
jgi:hypothetical protein